MQLYEYGSIKHKKKYGTNGMTKSNSYSTVNMMVYLIYSMSKWISTYFELLPSIGIPPIAASLLGR
ncbi:hypothetical protein Goklo_025107 [Gossypium klotzschianum]|uniref:Uncharacterized protein n=3 Tax=Gossypium TaxID=3633 RepID=A0A7J8WEB3_9ROSI|nr:hypothetical protein [Gossypium klotzschianum]